MAEPIDRKTTRWIIGHLFWDITGTADKGFRGWVSAQWRFFAAVAGAALLTWWEWIKHHPPEIVVIALIHFVFVLVAIALVLHIARWFSRSDKKLPGVHPKGPRGK
jgi:hypothetical protein